MTEALYDIRTKEQAQQTLTRLTGVPIDIWKRYINQESEYEFVDDLIWKVIKKYGSMPDNYKTFEFVFLHITTSNMDCESMQKNGLLDLQQSYKCADSELRHFLNGHDIYINLRNKTLKYNGRQYDISINRNPKTDVERNSWEIGRKFYFDYSVNGFLSIDPEKAYRGRIHKRPEILSNIDQLLNLNLSTGWEETHTPFEIVAKVKGKDLVCQTDKHLSDKQKTMSYITTAYHNAFTSPREITCRLKGHKSVSGEDVQIQPLKHWR